MLLFPLFIPMYTGIVRSSRLTVSEKSRLDRIVARLREQDAVDEHLRTRRIRERRKLAWETVHELVRQFRNADRSLMRVILFGSLARDELDTDTFDIDLAVDSERYLDLLGIAMKARIPTDLVDLRNAGTHIRAAVEREGVELYNADREEAAPAAGRA